MRGAVNAPPNSAIVVNGHAAVIDDAGQFHVNNVPLSGDVTTITATVTTQDGVSVSQSINVIDGGEPAFKVEPDAAWGLKQKQIILTTTNAGIAQIQRFEYDLNSDGVADYTAYPADFTNGRLQLLLTYSQPGRYVGRVIGYDAQNQPVLTAKFAIVMKNPGLLGSMLQGVFNQMLERLRAGNLEGALTAITSSSKDRYRSTLTSLLAADPNAVNQLGALVDGQVSESYAELVLGQDDASGSFAYFVNLVLGEDGIWRIESM